MSVDAILQQIDELTPADADMDPALAELLDERAAAYEANPAAVYTLDESIARARRPR